MGSTPARLRRLSFVHSNESQFLGSRKKRRSSPFLKLQLFLTVVLVADFCFLGKISAHFHVEGPSFCYLVVFATFAGTWKCVLSPFLQIGCTSTLNFWDIQGDNLPEMLHPQMEMVTKRTKTSCSHFCDDLWHW